ncbi:anthranilate synthase component I family protein [Vampirovibrio chlorellavorus]|uniref:anthranilate synthase component I family protein n=1 Tax=Vampirovibrio chlorellavorus TaxID=758823 RepID=UPI0026EEA2B3|nr:anthranilate synthase component I family protein [Vampirovibrio chlorellavorus]
MVALATHHLHRFFRQVSESAGEALMLGGSAEVTPLNQWVIVGLHARQTLRLQGKTLDWIDLGNHQRIDLTGHHARQHLFETLERARQQCQPWPNEKQALGLPMAGGLAGVLGYEFYRWCDSGWQQAAPPKTADWPELQLFEFEDWLFIDLKTAALTVLSKDAQRTATYQHLWQTCLEVSTATAKSSGEPDLNLDATAMAEYLERFQVSFQPEGFTQAVEQLKRDIFNGEVYQANLSLQLQKELSLDPYALFERLCLKNPSPFAGFLKSAHGVLVCNSPERLVQLDTQGRAQTRPIAGTRGRGQTPAEDEAIGQTLLNNEKEQAEHLMLVDLARNDLGRVCQPGSVQVDEFLVLERYSHVTHLVSNVTGQLKTQASGWDLLQSLFPGGTITGCPKIRCVELLSQLEPVSRGLYTGSLGYVDAASPALDFNILIRSVYLKPLPDPSGTGNDLPMRYNVAVHVGAGIVHDAIGPHEYRECLRKANAILNELHRLEAQPIPV